MSDKIRIQPLVDSETHKGLTEMAKENGAKVTPYAATVLKKHVEKNKPKPYRPKQEYGE